MRHILIILIRGSDIGKNEHSHLRVRKMCRNIESYVFRRVLNEHAFLLEGIMIYTTTKCPYCGFKTRNRQTGVPRRDLEQTVIKCSSCNLPIIDPINKEYEFMSKLQQKKWNTKNLLIISFIKAIIKLGIFLTIFIEGILNDDEALAGIFGFFFFSLLLWSIYVFYEGCTKHIGEQKIYESLLRTSNESYVSFLIMNAAYGKKTNYSPLPNRLEIINEYKKYSTKDIHDEACKKFLDTLSIIDKQNNNKISTNLTENYDYDTDNDLSVELISVDSNTIEFRDNKLFENENATTTNSLTLTKNNSKFYKIKNKLFEILNKIKDFAKKYIQKFTTFIKNLINKKTNKELLLELKELYDDGLTTEQEYNEKRKQYIDKI